MVRNHFSKYFLLTALSIFLFLIVDVTSWGNILNYPEYVRSVEPQWDLTYLIWRSSSSHCRFVSQVSQDKQPEVKQPESHLDRDSRSLMNSILQLRRSLQVILSSSALEGKTSPAKTGARAFIVFALYKTFFTVSTES